MNSRISILVTFFFFTFLEGSAAHLRLPALVGNHMVLQQQSTVNVWGWGKPGSRVSVSAGWDATPVSTVTGKDGLWKLNLQTIGAGGPYQLEIKSDTTYLLDNVLLGEVWVCSGQSNMQMPFKGYLSQPVKGSNDYIAHGHNNNIRLFTVGRNISVTPLSDCNGKWVVSNPTEVGNFSAVAYVFGKYLHDVLKVPVGLIHSSWGGTPAEAWTDAQTLGSSFNDIDLSILKSPEKVTSKSPAALFNAMIYPLVNFTIRGAIWYQGEANRNKPKQYAKLFPAMVENWRFHWKQTDFPFYFVQIAPYKYNESVNSAFLREAQLNSSLAIPQTGMAVTMDIGEQDCIHPAEKILVGKRLAYQALQKTYGMIDLQSDGPVFRKMEVDQNRATLSFDFADTGLSSFGSTLTGFTIAGPDKVFYPARATIKKAEVIVSSDEVSDPVAVRYCWENYVTGTLYNTAGIPASSFRTDSWDE